MDGTYPPPPFDTELLPVLRRINETIPATIDLDRMIRSRTAPRPPSGVEQRLAAGTLVCEDHEVDPASMVTPW
jgi:hypothetical protein